MGVRVKTPVPVAFENVNAWSVVEPNTRRSVSTLSLEVEARFWTERLVVVAFVPVAFKNVKFWRVEELVRASVDPEIAPSREFVESRFVVLKLVVVAEVPVAFKNVRFCNDEELVTERFKSVVPPETIKAVEDACCWTERYVVVAWVPVAFVNVNAWRVEEPESERLTEVTVPVAVTFATERISPESNALP